MMRALVVWAALFAGASGQACTPGPSNTMTQVSGSSALAPAGAAMGDLIGGSYLMSYSVGRSLALSGNGRVAVVTAYAKSTNTGAAYIYTRPDGQTAWALAQSLTGAATSNYFGNSVAVSYDGTAIAISSTSTSLTNGAGGAVGVWVKAAPTDATWTKSSDLVPPTGQAGWRFGGSLSFTLDGLTLAVGSEGWNGNTGAAYVYRRATAGTTAFGAAPQVLNYAITAATNEGYGAQVALSGDGSYLAVGAPGSKNVGSLNSGLVYVYIRNGAAQYVNGSLAWEGWRVVSADPGTSDKFGYALAMDGTGSTLVVGAPYKTTPAAYVFRRTGTGAAAVWSQEAKLTAVTASSLYARTVAISTDGGTIAVSQDMLSTGAIHLYRYGCGGSWSLQQSVTPVDTLSIAYFGWPVALSGDGNVLLGSNKGRNSNTGGFFVFTASEAAFAPPSPTASSSPTPSSSGAPAAASPSSSVSPSVSVSGSASATAVPTLSASPSTTPAASATRSGSASPLATPSTSVSASTSVSPSVTPSASASVAATVSPSLTPSLSSAATPAASPTVSPSGSPSTSPSRSPGSSSAATAPVSGTTTTSPSVTRTASASASTTTTRAASSTSTVSPSPSVTTSASAVASVSVSSSASGTPSTTVTASATATGSPSSSSSASSTASASSSSSPTASSSSTTAADASPSPSPSASSSPSPTASATGSAVVSASSSASPVAGAPQPSSSSSSAPAAASASPTAAAAAASTSSSATASPSPQGPAAGVGGINGLGAGNANNTAAGGGLPGQLGAGEPAGGSPAAAGTNDAAASPATAPAVGATLAIVAVIAAAAGFAYWRHRSAASKGLHTARRAHKAPAALPAGDYEPVVSPVHAVAVNVPASTSEASAAGGDLAGSGAKRFQFNPMLAVSARV